VGSHFAFPGGEIDFDCPNNYPWGSTGPTRLRATGAPLYEVQPLTFAAERRAICDACDGSTGLGPAGNVCWLKETTRCERNKVLRDPTESCMATPPKWDQVEPAP